MPRGGQAAARIRAAHGYSDLNKDDLAKEVGLSTRQLGRLESGDATPDRDTLDRIADVCGVPRAFMEIGFAPLAEPISDAEKRLYLIEQRVRAVEANVQPERLAEIFAPLLGSDGQGGQPDQSAPQRSRRVKGRPPASGGGAGA